MATINLFADQYKSAGFSQDRTHRYYLIRTWNRYEKPNDPIVCFIGLNPSTANEDVDDPTIRKCMKIARYNGYGGLVMLNLFSIVSADPAILLTDEAKDAAHQERNNYYIDHYTRDPTCKAVVFAWGNFTEAVERGRSMVARFPRARCLTINKNGTPKHPLYCKNESPFIAFNL